MSMSHVLMSSRRDKRLQYMCFCDLNHVVFRSSRTEPNSDTNNNISIINNYESNEECIKHDRVAVWRLLRRIQLLLHIIAGNFTHTHTNVNRWSFLSNSHIMKRLAIMAICAMCGFACEQNQKQQVPSKIVPTSFLLFGRRKEISFHLGKRISIFIDGEAFCL